MCYDLSLAVLHFECFSTWQKFIAYEITVFTSLFQQYCIFNAFQPDRNVKLTTKYIYDFSSALLHFQHFKMKENCKPDETTNEHWSVLSWSSRKGMKILDFVFQFAGQRKLKLNQKSQTFKVLVLQSNKLYINMSI